MKYTTIGSLMMGLCLVWACNNTETNSTTQPDDSTGTNRTADSAMKTPVAPMVLAEYSGKLPCADCMEIAVTLNLFSDSSFRRTSVYMGKSSDQFSDTGKWMLHGDTLHLNYNGQNNWYIKNDSGLVQLDMSKKRITGKFADKYVLKKTN
ncbi:MAG: copper resistance protein NlpE [Chitinophagaceae bacterium]